jgi:hypothetical protein
MESGCIGFLANQDRGVRHVQRGKEWRRAGALCRLGGSLSTDHMLPNYGPNHLVDRTRLSYKRHQDYDDHGQSTILPFLVFTFVSIRSSILGFMNDGYNERSPIASVQYLNHSFSGKSRPHWPLSCELACAGFHASQAWMCSQTRFLPHRSMYDEFLESFTMQGVLYSQLFISRCLLVRTLCRYATALVHHALLNSIREWVES